MVRKRIKEAEGVPNIVVPTIRDNSFFATFLRNWRADFAGCHLIVIEDRKNKQLNSILKDESTKNGYTYELYDWRDIDKDLGKDSWIISRRTDTVRDYGYLMAYRNKPLFIATLDDDLCPAERGKHIQQFYNILFTEVEQEAKYFSTMNNGMLPRGKLTGAKNKVGVAHGAWLNVPDFDAKTQIQETSSFVAGPTDYYNGIVPKGCFYSMCGMNLAWRPELTKFMYFPLMGAYTGNPIDRCGDIWAGYYSKYMCDLDDTLHHTGEPYCVHTRASNPWSNLKKEYREDVLGREFIKVLVYDGVPEIEKEYFNKLIDAYDTWERIIDEIDNS